MSTIIQTINGFADGWLKTMFAVLWQSALLVAIAALIIRCLRNRSPVLRYWLWQIVAIKLLLMPFWTQAVPLPAWPETKPAVESAAIPPHEFGGGADQIRPMQRNISSLPMNAGGTSTIEAYSVWHAFSTLTWRTWLLLFWTAVLCRQIVRLLMQRAQLIKLLKQSVPASGELAALVAELSGRIGLSRAPEAVSVAGDCPLFVCGVMRPKLILPDRLLDSLDPAQRRQVILHELAHVKRRDLVWGWPVEIAKITYFFNPLVYWIAHQLHLERELACDQLAMARSGHPPAEYAQTLVQVVGRSSEPAAVQAAAIAAGLTGDDGKRMKDEG